MAERLAGQRSLEDVKGWIAYAKRAQGLRDPVAFVVARLRDGEELPEEEPKSGDDGDDRSRYISGKYAEFIRH
jgi:hypothetical protein